MQAIKGRPLGLESVKVQRVSDTIAQQLEQLILEGTLAPGEKLPPERELAQQLGVSRPSLREAIMTLEAKGLLHSRRGGGTYVCDVVAGTITNPLAELLRSHPETLLDMLELRCALEEVAAFYAAQRRTEADLELICQRFRALESSYGKDLDAAADAQADTAFTMAIADASHNVALVHVMRGLIDLLKDSITRNLEVLHVRPGIHETLHAQHRKIFESVVDGDAEGAQAATHEHLEFIRSNLSELDAADRRQQRSLRRLRAFERGSADAARAPGGVSG